eukprot:3057067-Rhodomonas_salina.10
MGSEGGADGWGGGAGVADESEHGGGHGGSRRHSTEGGVLPASAKQTLLNFVHKARGIVHGDGTDSRPMLSDQDSQGGSVLEMAALEATKDGNNGTTRPTWSKRIAQSRPTNGHDNGGGVGSFRGANGGGSKHLRHVSEPPKVSAEAVRVQAEVNANETRRGSDDEVVGGAGRNGQKRVMRQESLERSAQQLLMDIENI